MWGNGFCPQRQEEQRRKEREASSSREEETLRNDQRQAKGSSEGNHCTFINTIKRNEKKRAAVCSDVNPFARGSKKPRRETAKGQESGVSDPGSVAVFQKADKDDEDRQGFIWPLFQPCSKGDAVADESLRKLEQGRLRKLEQELRILEEELKNETQPLWEEDEKVYADAVHRTTREATARASGKYRARWTALVSIKGIPVPIVPYSHTTGCLSVMPPRECHS
jgi:hypothetical protein